MFDFNSECFGENCIAHDAVQSIPPIKYMFNSAHSHEAPQTIYLYIVMNLQYIVSLVTLKYYISIFTC